MVSRYFDSQRPLIVAGAISAVCAMVLAIVAVFDGTQILGISRWIKPIKFFASISIFVWTIAVFLHHVAASELQKRSVSWTLIAIFVIEMTAIVGQAARGQRSHFNFATGFDSIVYAVMGIAIGISTVVVAFILFLYLTRPSDLSPTISAGIKLGLGIFILGCLQGAFMSAGTGHAVGAADGGPGLPFVNWSTTAGDLRVAHFFGLHSIQAIPIFAIISEAISPRFAKSATFAFAAAYLALFVAAFIQALAGKPLL